MSDSNLQPCYSHFPKADVFPLALTALRAVSLLSCVLCGLDSTLTKIPICHKNTELIHV